MADRVTVIGWDGSPLTAAARAAIDAATLVAAAGAPLRLLNLGPGVERMALGNVELVARRVAEHRGTAVVVTDGDPGFFGVVRTLRRPEYGLEMEVLPAVSSVAAAFARAGMPWDDAQIVSSHGRGGLRRAVNICRANPKVAVLTAPGAGASELALMLRDVHRTFVICEALGTPEENVTVLTSDRVPDHLWRDPNVVLVIGGSGNGGSPPPSGWLAGRPVDYPGTAARGWAQPTEQAAGQAGVPDELPAPVRALALARLGPRPGELLWDVGAGDGALAVDAARCGAAVIAVDRDPDACARLDVNARRAGVEVQTVLGTAPGVLADLPEPDLVLVRHGVAVLQACLTRRPERIVALPGGTGELEEVRGAFARAGYRVEGTLIHSSPLDAEGQLGAGVPRWVVWGDRV